MKKTGEKIESTTVEQEQEPIKEVKVKLTYSGIPDGEVFYRGTLNGQEQATELNPLIALTNQPQEFTLKGVASQIDALLERFEEDTRISISYL